MCEPIVRQVATPLTEQKKPGSTGLNKTNETPQILTGEKVNDVVCTGQNTDTTVYGSPKNVVHKPVCKKSVQKSVHKNYTGRGTRARSWCVTAHDTKKYSQWQKLDTTTHGIRYFVYQLEKCPTTGKTHIQGYVEFYKKLRLHQVKDRLGDPTLHLEKRRGTRQQARDYSCKEDTPWYHVHYPQWRSHGYRLPHTEAIHLGAWETRQGHRSDVEQVADAVLRGWSETQIAAAFPSIYMRMSRGISRLIERRDMQTTGKWKDIKIDVLWGPPGAGKTRHVLDTHGPENVYIAEITEDGKLWFDGYEGQKVLLINEFYGQMRSSYMQNLLDKYRKRLAVKGGHTVSAWDKIYITSNTHPRNWYHGWRDIPEAVERSFIRRFTRVIEMEGPPQAEPLTWEGLDHIKLADGRVLKSRDSPRAKKKRRRRKKKRKGWGALVLPPTTSGPGPSQTTEDWESEEQSDDDTTDSAYNDSHPNDSMRYCAALEYLTCQ